jgi:protein-arginine kinase activator protein McsA
MMSKEAQAAGKKKPLVCPDCHMTFLDQVTLNEHNKKDDSSDPEPPIGVG